MSAGNAGEQLHARRYATPAAAMMQHHRECSTCSWAALLAEFAGHRLCEGRGPAFTSVRCTSLLSSQATTSLATKGGTTVSAAPCRMRTGHRTCAGGRMQSASIRQRAESGSQATTSVATRSAPFELKCKICATCFNAAFSREVSTDPKVNTGVQKVKVVHM